MHTDLGRRRRTGRGRALLPLLVWLALAIIVTGCSRRTAGAARPEPRPLAAQYASPALPAQVTVPAAVAVTQVHPDRTSSATASAGSDPPHDAVPEPTGDLSLGEALGLALQWSPTLVACAHEVEAAEARASQAGLWRNPEIDVRRDRLWPSGGEETTDEARTRIILSQVLELASTPDRRRAVGRAQSELAAWDCEAERLQVAAGVVRAYAVVLGAQEKLTRLEEVRDYVLEVQRGIVIRVTGGELPERRLKQMIRHAAGAEIEVRRGEAELAAARQALAATWGGHAARFGRLPGRLEELPGLPDTAAVRAAVEQSPAVARWQSEIARAEAAAALARAEAWPDLRLDAGTRRMDATGERTYLLGFELSLPIFDRAQGERRAARHDLTATWARQAAARAEVSVAAMAAYQELAASQFAARTLRERVIPAATDELAALERGYAENVFSVADLVDGARDLARAEIDYLDALVACHQALAELEGLTGQPLAGVTAGE